MKKLNLCQNGNSIWLVLLWTISLFKCNNIILYSKGHLFLSPLIIGTTLLPKLWLTEHFLLTTAFVNASLGYGLYQYIVPLIVTLFPSLNSDRILYLNFLHWICPDYWIYLDYNIWLFFWLSHFPWFFAWLPHLSDLPWFLLHHQSLRRGHLFRFGLHLDYCILWAFPQGVLHCWVYRHWLLWLTLI